MLTTLMQLMAVNESYCPIIVILFLSFPLPLTLQQLACHSNHEFRAFELVDMMTSEQGVSGCYCVSYPLLFTSWS